MERELKGYVVHNLGFANPAPVAQSFSFANAGMCVRVRPAFRRRRARPAVIALPAMAWLLVGASAFAQGTSREPEAVPFNRWDLSAGVGLHYFATRELDETDGWWDEKLQLRFQAGRYVSPHLKAEIAVAGPSTYETYESTRIPVAGLPNGGFAYNDRRVRVVSLTPTFTYQFLENAFAHPFVSAGASLNIVDDHRFRLETTSTINRVTYSVPALDTRETSLQTRPFVAAGFKSYFNERTFVRPELQVGFGAHGAAQMNIRFDFGIDF